MTCNYCSKSLVKSYRRKISKSGLRFCNHSCRGNYHVRDRERRFWDKVIKGDKPNDCWKWVGNKHEFGYGFIANFGAHRFSYMLHKGTIPKGKEVQHICNNPECNNPKHLILGDASSNAKYRSFSGRGGVGENSGTAKLKINQVIAIRKIASIMDISHREIGEMFGVSRPTITAILSERNWKKKKDNPYF